MTLYEVHLCVALLMLSAKPDQNDAEIFTCLDKSDATLLSKFGNGIGLLNQEFRSLLGKTHSGLGFSFAAHWLLESQGHYFEIRKTGLGKKHFEEGVPVDSVEWSPERIYKRLLVGHTSHSIAEINVIGQKLMPEKHYNPLIMNCQTEMKRLAKKIVTHPASDFKWPAGSFNVIYNAIEVASVALAFVAYGPLGDMTRAQCAGNMKILREGIEELKIPLQALLFDVAKLAKEAINIDKVQQIGDCLISFLTFHDKECIGLFKGASGYLEYWGRWLVGVGIVIAIPFTVYQLATSCVYFYQDVAKSGLITAVWNSTAPGWTVPFWAAVCGGPEAAAFVGTFYLMRTGCSWSAKLCMWAWAQGKDTREILMKITSGKNLSIKATHIVY